MVRIGRVQEMSALELSFEIGRLAANCLMGIGARRLPFFASVEAGGVLRLVDRAFGGTGEAPAALPDAFPLSAELMIGKLEAMIGTALATALGNRADGGIQVIRRDGDFTMLDPFPSGETVAVMPLEIEEPGRSAWKMTLAFPMAMLANLFGSEEPAPRARRRRAAPAEGVDAPFADLPLPVSAVLVDTRISFSALSALRPGQVIPVAVARNVPLRIGDRTIAHGTIGALDDRVAVQITQAF